MMGKLERSISLPGLSGFKNQIKEKKQHNYLMGVAECKKIFTA